MPESKRTKSRINPDIVRKAYNYVVELLTKELPDAYCFHNLGHTKEVLKQVTIIGEYTQLTKYEMSILQVSAIFHDTGYIKTYKGHEKESIKIAERFLKTHRITESQIKKVSNAIMSTRVPQQPNDMLSRILCDADLINLTYDHYFESAELMRQEWLKAGVANMNELEFHNNSLKFFEAHNFHTEYARRFFEPQKEKVYKRIQKRQVDLTINPTL